MPGVCYRVFHTDETRLRGALGALASAGDVTAQELLDEISAAQDAPARARVYTNGKYARLYERGMFGNSTPRPLTSKDLSFRFSFDLPGSLTVLAFFKVVSLGAQGVESTFLVASLLPVAVPGKGPPPRPLLAFAGWSDEGHARLKVTVVRGSQTASHWRLRRSFAESDDPLRMPVVAGQLMPEGTGEEPVAFEIEDAGQDAFAGGALPAWTRMSWRVELQAPGYGGSTLPGEWSAASAAVSAMLVPAAPAAAVNLVIKEQTPDSVTLNWEHSEPLRRGSAGGYAFDVYRFQPGRGGLRIGTVSVDDPDGGSRSEGARIFGFTDKSAPAGADASWAVVTIDPIGRPSPPSNSIARSRAP